jgi:hypothetical protein
MTSKRLGHFVHAVAIPFVVALLLSSCFRRTGSGIGSVSAPNQVPTVDHVGNQSSTNMVCADSERRLSMRPGNGRDIDMVWERIR